jgi:AhpC/TSA family
MKRGRLHKGNYLILAALLSLSWLTVACGSATPTTAPVSGQPQAVAPTNTTGQAQANPPTTAPNTVAAIATTAPTVAPATAQAVAPLQPTAKAQPAMGVQVGLTAPDFTAKLYTGEEVKLSQYKGKGVLLNFWATF